MDTRANAGDEGARGNWFAVQYLKVKKMLHNYKVFRMVASAAPLALAAGCANQSAAPARDAIQNAINAMGGGFGAKPSVGTAEAGAAPQSHGKTASINGALIWVDGDRPTDPRWAGKRISETPLLRFFEQHPISRPGEYFPRVGIRIDDYSETLVADFPSTAHLASRAGASPRPIECIKFTAMVWTSPKLSKKFDNIVLCSSEISSKDGVMSLGALKNYANNAYAPISISSMQSRTLGPREPEKLLPNFTQADIALYAQGQHLFSSLFTQLGFQGPVDGDQRLWFANLAAPAK